MTSRTLLVAFATLVVGATARSDSGPALSGAEKTSLTLRVLRTEVGGPTEQISSAGPSLVAGQSGRAYWISGMQCDYQAVGAGDPSAEYVKDTGLLVRAEFNLVSADTDKATFDVSWHHGEPASAREMGPPRRVTLAHGESHTLGFLSGPGEGTCGGILRFDVDTSVVEDPQFEESRLAYELWLIDDGPDGERRTARLDLVGTQGEAVPFRFDAMRWAVADARYGDGRGVEATAWISGTVEGRLRRDGYIALELDAKRFHSIVPAGSGRRGGIGDLGRKLLTVRAGETVALVLPAARGWGADWTDPSGTVSGTISTQPAKIPFSKDGIDVVPGRVAVDFERFFAGHRMSLRLTARPL